MKLELLTNATVVDDAIRFVNGRTIGKKGRTIEPFRSFDILKYFYVHHGLMTCVNEDGHTLIVIIKLSLPCLTYR
jgi:hypothetical protein